MKKDLLLVLGIGCIVFLGVSGFSTSSVMHGWNGTYWRPIGINESTRAMIAIDYKHHEQHEGKDYQFWAYDSDLDSGATMGYIITTPNTTAWAHMTWEITGALTTLVQVYEDTTHSPVSGQNIYNKNRNSSNTSGVTIATAATDGSDGTGPIDGASFGISTGEGVRQISGGGDGQGGHEFILKQNSKYYLVVTSGADNNNVTLKVNWYEHTDKSQ